MDLQKFKSFLIGYSKNQIYYSIFGGFTGGIYGGLIQYDTKKDTKKEKQDSISFCTVTGIIFGLLPIVPITSLGALSLIKINEKVVNKIENVCYNKTNDVN